MNDPVAERLDDLICACRAITAYVARADLPAELVADAVRMRLVEIGEVVRQLPVSATRAEPGIPWTRLALLGERIVRRGADAGASIVLGTARTDVPALAAAAERLRERRNARHHEG